MITTAPTTAINHTASKEIRLGLGRYNRAARGYLNMSLPSGKIFMK